MKKRKNEIARTAAFAEKVSIIAQTMHVIGNIDSESDIRIDGSVFGNVICKAKVVIVSSGKVEGDIQAANVDVHGIVRGNITVSDMLSLKSGCSIDGNLVTEKIQIEPNSVFNGQCTMTSEVKLAFVNEEGIYFKEN